MNITNTTCTSCGACVSICPHNAIDFFLSSNGQPLPKINGALCTECSLCNKVCPQNNPPKSLFPDKCFVAYSNNKKDLIYSASGGVASIFYRYALDNNMVAYGCDYSEDGDLNHKRLLNESDIWKAKSSKYSQSSTAGVFKEIKIYLDNGRSVLFVGTPCQIAGLLKFLTRSYEKLITIDLICHGTPPNSLLKKHICEQGVEFPISKIRFRGEFDQMLTIWKNDVVIYKQDKNKDLYFSAFYQNMISCDSCYDCQYAAPKRISDLTIGDFWGLGQLDKIEPQGDRPSIILVNTQKGWDFLRAAANQLIFEERSVEEGIAGNGRLNHPPGKSLHAKYFQMCYKLNFGFKKSIYIANHLVLYRAKIAKIKFKIKKLLVKNDT